jgi:cell division protein FtsA
MKQKEIFAAGLDVGSAYTRCVIAKVGGDGQPEDRFQCLGYGSVPSSGWTKSRITDHQAVTDCISAAVREAEAMSGTQVQSVVAGLGGLSVRGANSRGKFDLGRPREVTDKDVKNAVRRAMRIQLQEDRMILQVLPQDFVVDDHPGFHDPRQMLGSAIEANAHIVTASTQEHNTLVGAINRASLSVQETVHEAIAAAYACVLEEDRREGVALIDIGQHSTEMVCYYGESAQLVSSLRICGDHFSRDLAHALRIPVEAGQVVKEQFGSAVAEGTPERSFVELPTPDGVEKDAPRRFINEILESRAKELFEMVGTELARFGMQRAIASGLVITGGGALLHSICDVAERVLECPVRTGLAQGVSDWPDALQDPSWTTVAGLAMYSARHHTHPEVAMQSAGILSRIF